MEKASIDHVALSLLLVQHGATLTMQRDGAANAFSIRYVGGISKHYEYAKICRDGHVWHRYTPHLGEAIDYIRHFHPKRAFKLKTKHGRP